MDNREKLQSILKAGSVDALLLTSQVSRKYAATYDIREGLAVIGSSQSFYFTDSRYIEDAQNNLSGFTVQVVDKDNTYSQRINGALELLDVQYLGIEEDYLLYSELLRFEKELHAKLIPSQKEISKFRQIKEPWEIDEIIRAQRIAEQTFQEMLEIIRPGMTEKKLAAHLISSLYHNGGESLSFPPIVVSGPNTSLPHGVPGDRQFQYGDFITMDFGCKVNGYCSDMTRTVALGFISEEMSHVYETVLRAQESAIAATKAGVIGAEVDAVARKIICEAGYGQYFGHGYGHGLGLEVHETPNCNPGNLLPLPAGAVCSAEPGIYLPGKFGVRIEDTVVITEDGCRNITQSPKNLIII